MYTVLLEMLERSRDIEISKKRLDLSLSLYFDKWYLFFLNKITIKFYQILLLLVVFTFHFNIQLMFTSVKKNKGKRWWYSCVIKRENTVYKRTAARARGGGIWAKRQTTETIFFGFENDWIFGRETSCFDDGSSTFPWYNGLPPPTNQPHKIK